MALFSKNFNFNIKRDQQKISYERRVYESVDEKSLSLAMSRKTAKNKNSGVLRLIFVFCFNGSKLVNYYLSDRKYLIFYKDNIEFLIQIAVRNYVLRLNFFSSKYFLYYAVFYNTTVHVRLRTYHIIYF